MIIIKRYEAWQHIMEWKILSGEHKQVLLVPNATITSTSVRLEHSYCRIGQKKHQYTDYMDKNKIPRSVIRQQQQQ